MNLGAMEGGGGGGGGGGEKEGKNGELEGRRRRGEKEK